MRITETSESCRCRFECELKSLLVESGSESLCVCVWRERVAPRSGVEGPVCVCVCVCVCAVWSAHSHQFRQVAGVA